MNIHTSNDNICVYCGEPSTETRKLYYDECRLINNGTNYTVDCCEECNSILGNDMHPNHESALEDVMHHYRILDRSFTAKKSWTEERLAQIKRKRNWDARFTTDRMVGMPKLVEIYFTPN